MPLCGILISQYIVTKMSKKEILYFVKSCNKSIRKNTPVYSSYVFLSLRKCVCIKMNISIEILICIRFIELDLIPYSSYMLPLFMRSPSKIRSVTFYNIKIPDLYICLDIKIPF